jgi:hypothetical protein
MACRRANDAAPVAGQRSSDGLACSTSVARRCQHQRKPAWLGVRASPRRHQGLVQPDLERTSRGVAPREHPGRHALDDQDRSRIMSRSAASSLVASAPMRARNVRTTSDSQLERARRAASLNRGPSRSKAVISRCQWACASVRCSSCALPSAARCCAGRSAASQAGRSRRGIRDPGRSGIAVASPQKPGAAHLTRVRAPAGMSRHPSPPTS